MSEKEPIHGVFPEIVNSPEHYLHYPLETIEIIHCVLEHKYGPIGPEICDFAHELKYRLRAGFKKTDDDGILEDIKKALKYNSIRTQGIKNKA